MNVDPSTVKGLARAEWEQFAGSKTVKAILALVISTTGAYVQGLLTGQETVPFKVWLASLAASIVALAVRHALAGIEAKQDLILAGRGLGGEVS